MRYAIVSDIHGNLQAWEAVRRDIAEAGVDSIICLGDIVGYGPRPGEVLDSVWEHASDIVIGNHDAVVAGRLDAGIFNARARRMIDWTIHALDPSIPGILARLPSVLEGDQFTLTHAELSDPERYDYILTKADVAENFEAGDQSLLFVGHSHDPRIFVLEKESGRIGELSLQDFTVRDESRYIVNVGSVGDPRDGRILSSYCLYDSDTHGVSHRSVAFDVEAFRADLLTCRVPVKPWFLMCWDKQARGAHRIDELSVDIRTIVRQKKQIVIKRLQQEADDSEKARQTEIRQILRDAKEARSERERLRRDATMLARKKREEEERIAAEAELKQKMARQAAAVKPKDEYRKQGVIKAASFAERLRERKEEHAKRAAEKAVLLRQRKLELAEVAEQRRRDKREATEKAREEERARVRETIEKRKLAAKKTSSQTH